MCLAFVAQVLLHSARYLPQEVACLCQFSLLSAAQPSLRPTAVLLSLKAASELDFSSHLVLVFFLFRALPQPEFSLPLNYASEGGREPAKLLIAPFTSADLPLGPAEQEV